MHDWVTVAGHSVIGAICTALLFGVRFHVRKEVNGDGRPKIKWDFWIEGKKQ